MLTCARFCDYHSMDNIEYIFTDEEIKEIQAHIAKYPDRRSAVMPALWIAQEKFGWLSLDAIKLVATTIDIPYAHVYGVASFYTMYFKKKMPKHLIEICTCFSCLEVGGPEMMSYLKDHIKADENGVGEEGKIWVREAECLGACDSAPMCQVTNRRYVHNLTEEKINNLVKKLRNDEEIPYERIPLNDQSILD